MTRNDIAIIICNYNGGPDTIKCIDAVIKSKEVMSDIYVIDNASTDDSVPLIQKRFSSQVTIIQNAENLGGSGGFGRGLRLTVDKGYPYIMMLDNDAYVDTDTIKQLYEYLLENPDVGIVGAKIMMSDDPDRIMDYAKRINFETFIDESEWCWKLDSDEARLPRDCDFAAATAAMTRREVLLECGGMDEDYFIYYDDIDLGYRIKKHGYRVVSLGSTKAWHKSGMRQKKTNTFARYYLTRNRYRFFAKYIPDEDLERFTEYILSRAFSYMYGSYYKGRIDIFDTEKYILEDFIRDRRGKAGPRRVNELQTDIDRLIQEELSACGSILMYPAREVAERYLVKWCNKIRSWNPDTRLVISTAFHMENEKEFDKIIHFCKHVREVKEYHFQEHILPEIYIDIYGNMIANEQDYLYFRNYENSYAFFKAIYHDSVIETINKIRQENLKK